MYKSRLCRCFSYVKANLKGKKYPQYNIIHSCLYHCVFLSGCTYTLLVPLSKPYTTVNLKLLTQSCEKSCLSCHHWLFSLVLQWDSNSSEVIDSYISYYSRAGTNVPLFPLLYSHTRQPQPETHPESTYVWLGHFIDWFTPPAVDLIGLVKGRLSFFLKTQQKSLQPLSPQPHKPQSFSIHPHTIGTISHTKEVVKSFIVFSIHQI